MTPESGQGDSTRAATTELKSILQNLTARRTAVASDLRVLDEWIILVRQALGALRRPRRASPSAPSENDSVDATLSNSEMLQQLLAQAPDGLRVSEMVGLLRAAGHRLAKTLEPIKMTSNQLARMRHRGLVSKDRITRKYRLVPRDQAGTSE